MGVEAFGAVKFEKPGAPANALEVRVFRFAPPELALRCREATYESDRGKQTYDVRRLTDRTMYESKGRPKIVLFKNDYWITVGHRGDDGLHLTVLDQYIKLPEQIKP